MIKVILWITLGYLICYYGVLNSIGNYIVTSDIIDLIIGFLEGFKTSEEI